MCFVVVLTYCLFLCLFQLIMTGENAKGDEAKGDKVKVDKGKGVKAKSDSMADVAEKKKAMLEKRKALLESNKRKATTSDLTIAGTVFKCCLC